MDYDEDEELIHNCNFPLYVKKAIQELQGIAAAIIYDNELDDNEIRLLFDWVKHHIDITSEYPISELAPLLGRVIKEGKCTPDLREAIFKVISSFAADNQQSPIIDNVFDTNCEIKFTGCKFLFTGKLSCCDRTEAQKIVSSLGGIASNSSNISREIDYLVVGDSGNLDWKYSRFGSKIEKAIKYRNSYQKPFIISEGQFFEAVKNFKSIKKSHTKKNILSGKLVSFTGAFKYYSRSGIIFEIQKLGGIYTNEITNKVNYLIVGTIKVPDKKYEEAIRKGVKVISEDDFFKIVD